MAKKITLADLVAKAQRGELTEADVRKYIKPAVSAAGLPDARINRRAVDVTGVEQAADALAAALAEDVGRRLAAAPAAKRGPSMAAAKAAAPAPNGSIVAEGDSWFNLPNIVAPRTLVDHLGDQFPVNNIAYWGHRLIEEIFHSQEYLNWAGPRLRFFIFDGGGNDVFALLTSLIDQRKSGDTDPANARNYLNAAYRGLMRVMEGYYDVIFADINRLAPAAKIIVHGYDYGNPVREGPYVGSKLLFRGFDLRGQTRKISLALLHAMLDDFNDMVKRAAGRAQNVTYVDLRNTVTSRGGWFDEIHPKGTAARKIARDFFVPLLAGPTA